ATCNKLGLRLAREAFPDRAYNPDGTLVSRSEPGAVLDDPEQVAEMALVMARDQMALTPAGERVPLQAKTLCVHGDSPAAVESVRLIRSTLQKNNIQITSIRRLV
ncbi:MAG: LamB/YcsF family protein, partial [Desulfohalobiaceae bacterium]